MKSGIQLSPVHMSYPPFIHSFSSLNNAENRAAALSGIRVGSSAGGARSKALVALSSKGNAQVGYLYSQIIVYQIRDAFEQFSNMAVKMGLSKELRKTIEANLRLGIVGARRA